MAGGSGFILMHRGWQDHEVFRGEPFSKRDAFVWMIEKAAYQEGRVLAPRGYVELQRGQLCFSLRYLATAWKWHEPKVRRFLGSLASAKIIDALSDAGQTVITICNYDKYQAFDAQADAPMGASMTQPRRTTDANRKERHESITPPTPPSELPLASEQDEGDGKTDRHGKPYRFAGSVIRLTASDFEQWQRSYHAIPDLEAALRAMDDWWREQPDEACKNWFFRTSRNLQRKHEEAMAAKAASRPFVGYDPNDPDALYREQRERDRIEEDESRRRREDGLRWKRDQEARRAAEASKAVH